MPLEVKFSTSVLFAALARRTAYAKRIIFPLPYSPGRLTMGEKYALVKPLMPSSLCHVIMFSSILTHKEGSQVTKEMRLIGSASPSFPPYCQHKGQQSRTQVVRRVLRFRACVDIFFCFIVLTPYCELSTIGPTKTCVQNRGRLTITAGRKGNKK